MRPILLLLFFALLSQLSWAQEYCDRPFTENNYDDIQRQEKVYGTGVTPRGTTVDLLLDIYYTSENKSEISPAVVLLHGGAFIKEQGDKSQMKELAEYFVSRGFVVFSIGYRTWSIIRDGFPEAPNIIDVSMKALQDVQKAIEYIVSENDGGTFPVVDVQQLVLGGASAGAITINNRLYFDAQDSIPGFLQDAIDQNQLEFPEPSNDYSIVYGINLSGGIFDTSWIDAEDPPLISIHGTADSTIAYDYGLAAGVIDLYGSNPMDERLHSLGIDSYLYTFEGGGHTDIYANTSYRETLLSALDTGLLRIQERICLMTNVALSALTADVRLINTLVQEALILENGEKDQMQYEIIDLKGRRIQTGSLIPGRQRIPLSVGPSGYYVFRAIGKGGIYVQPFVRP